MTAAAAAAGSTAAELQGGRDDVICRVQRV